MTNSQIPNLRNDGEKEQRRPDFTMQEYVDLVRFCWRKWINAGKQNLITNKRHILRDYILFLSNTGVRPGTETDELQWKHIRLVTQGGVEYVAISVNGKTGQREVIARHNIYRPLERLLQRQTKYAKLTLRDALKQQLDAYVFALPDGSEVKNLTAPFKVLMKQSGLWIDPRTNKKRTFYSFRHFYITQALLKGTSPAKVTSQCGTSLAMIDKYYSHVTALLAARELAGTKHLTKQQLSQAKKEWQIA